MVETYLETPVDRVRKSQTAHINDIQRKKMLDVIAKCNIKILNYLDLTLNLKDGKYKILIKIKTK